MGIVGAFLGNDALVNNFVGLSDIELRAFDKIREIALKDFACAGIRMTNRRYALMDRDPTHDQAKAERFASSVLDLPSPLR